MAIRRLSLLCSVLSGLAVLAAGSFGHAQQVDETLEPYRMLRSLQFVQDTVVRGDHSAADMQRFMLGTIDERLRTADPKTFQDPRNVDAALIYAMSGGNPATLEYLVARDIDGNFDNRVSDALRKYLSGKGTLIAKTLGDMAVEYKNAKIGPYLALVAGNVTLTKDPAAALKFYDWARLTAPGTIVEEAALRRSLAVAVDAKIVDKASLYANGYARRFLYSPYASQFADLFVRFVVEHYEVLKPEDIDATLGYMDVDRRREVYLRVAREAAIAGRKELATMAAEQAKLLSGSEEGADALARLYGSLVGVPTENVDDAMAVLMTIPEEALSPRDRALRQAAETVAKEVLRKPEPAQKPQLPPAEVSAESAALEAAAADQDLQDPFAQPQQTESALPEAEVQPAAAAPETPPAEQAEIDPELRTFVETGRSKLDAIDDLLQKEGP
ncbi:chemotaxis protein MotC [Rhizobium rosettiformans]|uniref:Chemotaxis protein n=2 Tax=Rhizobium rosettiformans TaxID=1368430 RepID=A0A4S8PRC7_9HYPH|nr:chemotaxis protein MotC [Rhizobium rosettiformans]MBB5277477.1 chemotaxis protein MotC [Rhizobium rosettiformans]THV33793.1 chemotaxis protein [Rhizobium rosettiformans W3]